MRGVLKFTDSSEVPSGQGIVIQVLDTSRVGADAVNVVETHITVPEDFDAGIDDLPFEMDVPDNREELTVRAHLARHDGADIQSGDMITMVSIPVPAREEEEVALPLRTV